MSKVRKQAAEDEKGEKRKKMKILGEKGHWQKKMRKDETAEHGDRV